MKTRISIFALLAMVGFSEAAVLVESRSMRDYVVELRNQALDFTDAKKYTPPTARQRTQFARMAAFIAAGDLVEADGIAKALGYEVVDLTDTDEGGNYHHLREITVGGKVVNGWGSYFYNPSSTNSVLIQAPHILHDTHSYDVATVAMIHSGAAGLMFNGAHRDSGGVAKSNVSDVARLPESIFHTVHRTWTTDASMQAWQIHGFDLTQHPRIPAGTDVVLSNGNGRASREIIRLAAAFEATAFINDAQSITHAYNTMDMNDPANVAVNGNVDGRAMRSLGGTRNVQGVFTRKLGGTFVHIELERSIRLDGTPREDRENRERAGLAIARAIPLVP